MKLSAVLLSTALAAGSMMTVNAHADSTARVAAASALGSVAGTALGKNMGATQVQQLVQLLAVLVVQL